MVRGGPQPTGAGQTPFVRLPPAPGSRFLEPLARNVLALGSRGTRGYRADPVRCVRCVAS